MSMKELWLPYSDIFSLLALVAIYLPLIKAQRAINISQQDDEGSANNSFTVANFLWLSFGALLWMLVVVGFLVTFGKIPPG
jgi:hypothetical protein